MATEFKPLQSDAIAELMKNTRNRNSYGPNFMEFAESDEAGINPAEVWPVEYGHKEASTLYQGFLTAIKKAGLEDKFMVKKVGDDCFLLNKEKVNLILAGSNGNEPDESEPSEEA